MASFKDMIELDVTGVFLNTNDFAVLVKYTPHNGSAIEDVPAIADFDMKLAPAEYGDNELVNWIVPANSIADPGIYDVIEYDGIEYRVRQRMSGDLGGTWTLTTEADRRQRPGNVRS